MPGIYIHIPFCKKRCSYCDFYSTTDLQNTSLFVDSLLREIRLRKNYLSDSRIQTIYFGGGTPTLLNITEFEKIFDALFNTYLIEPDSEITLEANPDDLTNEYLEEIKKLPFNRLSIGIQSFDEEDLKNINRRHTAEQALNVVEDARFYGFNNISIDLIYGLPYQTLEKWKQQLNIALNLGVQHISAYGLTYEEGTPLWKLRKMNRIKAVTDEEMIRMYSLLADKTSEKGYERYEISNFALKGFRSRHNASYWQQKQYIGFGPSAHSYDLVSRQWNVNSIKEYIHALSNEKVPAEKEVLSLYEQYNDYIMISLRTAEGINLQVLEDKFGGDLKDYCLQNIKTFIETQKVDCTNHTLRLTMNGIMVSDQIIMELMKI